MNISILNNIFAKDIYYYDYKLNNGMLSWLLVPISFYILYYKTYIKYFSYIFVVIAIIGIVDTILLFEKYNYFFLISASIILHTILLYPLTNIKKYLKLNISNIILGLLGIIIIAFLPYWPYILYKPMVVKIMLLIYVFLFLLYNFHK
tara:strand:- start:1712 stop:2155 length:444 start_codon:yes stop_codon:yes gene_type:complete